MSDEEHRRELSEMLRGSDVTPALVIELGALLQGAQGGGGVRVSDVVEAMHGYQGLSPNGREAFERLLKDGWSGTVTELVSVSAALE